METVMKMKRFQITEAEYEAIKAKEAKTKDKNISRRLRVLMLRYEGKKLDEITKMTNLHRTSITQMCRRYREQGLEEYARNKYQSHHWLLSWEQEEEILNQFNDGPVNKLPQMKSKQFWIKPVARIPGACMSTMY